MSTYLDPSFVSDLAHGLLTTSASKLSSPPTIQAVKMGEPVDDGCDALYVWVNDFHLTHPRRQTAFGGGGMSEERGSMEPGGAIPSVDFTVQLFRCGVPQPYGDLALNPPSAADEDAFATSLLIDGWSLYQGLLAANHAGTLFGVTAQQFETHTLVGKMTPVVKGQTASWTVPIKRALY